MASVMEDSSKYPLEMMKCLDGFRALKQNTCYPFLLYVFDNEDYRQHTLLLLVWR